MGSQGSSTLFSSSSLFDESRWVRYVSSALEEEEEKEVKIPVTVFSVPKPLLSAKPEAYTPQLFSLGPYHHWQPKVYEMERYKLATAKRTQRQLQTLNLKQLADHFTEHEYIIRSHYHRYLEYTGETLAWLMIIDGSFLLEFLRNYSNIDDKVFTKVPSMAHIVDSARIKLAYNLILRDIVMLENQIPLYVVREILCYQSKTHEIADDQLSKMLIGFVKEVSPFNVTENLSCIDDKQHAHLLQLIYCVIVPKDKIVCENFEIEQHIDMPESKEEIIGDPSSVEQIYNWVKGLNISPVRMVKNIVGEPMKFLVKVPLNIISHLPGISDLKGPIESIFAFKGKGKSKSKDEDSDDTKPPLVEEIMIPSVSELTKAGVKFSAASGDLTTTMFDSKTVTFYLPTVSLDLNTEVLLRNLVAYETSVESGPLVFTRYTELINGIIDSEEDVKLLRQSGIILNRMKNDSEVADLWNGMSRSVRLTKVGFIDKVLVDVNTYYNNRWSVKSRKFMKTYVLGSWQFLTFIAAILLLLLTCIQAFCSVYESRGAAPNLRDSGCLESNPAAECFKTAVIWLFKTTVM